MKEAVQSAVDALKRGEVILYPTDTIWGIGCDATNPDAIEKVYKIKARDLNKPLLVILDDDRNLNRYIKEVPDVAWDLLDHSDKPMTIIYPEAYNLAPNLPAVDGSIGIRIVKHDFCQAVLRKFNKPLVSTSANFSGEPSPKSFEEISQRLRDAVDYVVPSSIKAGGNRASSIIKLGVGGQVQIIRK